MIRMRQLLISAIVLAAGITTASAQPTEVTSVFAGSAHRITAGTLLSDVSTTIQFQAATAPIRPVATGCFANFPEGTIGRRYRAFVALEMQCGDGTSFKLPELKVRSQPGKNKNTVRLVAFTGLTGACPAPVEITAKLRLKGGALRRFVNAGTEPPAEGLPFDVICGTGQDFSTASAP